MTEKIEQFDETAHSAPFGAVATHDTEGVFDFPLRIGLPWIRTIITIAIFIALAMALSHLMGLSARMQPVASGVGAIVGVAAMGYSARRAARQEKRDAPAKSEAEIIGDLQAHMLRFGVYGLMYSGRENGVTQAVRGLAACGCVGRVYRFSGTPTELPPIPPPLEEPFEATPLSEKTDAFNELRGGRASAKERFQSSWRTMMNFYGKRRWFRWFMWTCLIIGVVSLPVQAFLAIRQMLAGQVPPALLIIGIATVFTAVYVVVRGRRPRLWFLVPGGLLVLKSVWKSDKWTYALLPRDESVLLYIENQNILGAARQGGFAGWRIVSPREFELVLRAWQSPQPPPSDAQLAAFAENV